jgi:hypothetical protein
VGKVHKFVYLFMALMLVSAPVLACSLPGLAMNDQEKDCCHHMSDECGSTQMDESHSCCSKAPTLGAGTLQPTVKYSAASPDLVNHVEPVAVQPGSMAGHALAGSVIDSSSKSPPGHISVLRI